MVRGSGVRGNGGKTNSGKDFDNEKRNLTVVRSEILRLGAFDSVRGRPRIALSRICLCTHRKNNVFFEGKPTEITREIPGKQETFQERARRYDAILRDDYFIRLEI